MILNNVENIYIGGTKVEKVMFNLMPIWPRLQDTVAESMRRLNFFGQQNVGGGSSFSGDDLSSGGEKGRFGSGSGLNKNK